MLSFYQFCLNCIEFPKLVTKTEEFIESSQLKMNSECFSGNCVLWFLLERRLSSSQEIRTPDWLHVISIAFLWKNSWNN